MKKQKNLPMFAVGNEYDMWRSMDAEQPIRVKVGVCVPVECRSHNDWIVTLVNPKTGKVIDIMHEMNFLARIQNPFAMAFFGIGDWQWLLDTKLPVYWH